MINLLQSAVASSERIFEILDETEETADDPGSLDPAKGSGEVSFTEVTFGYQPGAPLFENLNLHVEPGHTVAIVGPTGAGKTTLVNLLMRFYEVWSGSISVDGRGLRAYPRGRLRRRFGMVLQDTWLFKGTLLDNIAYGRSGATDADIHAAAQAAHADHFIRALPEGYRTVLNEDASNISAGEKQLITLARALLADPEILILDEATSNVDTRTELLIQKAMKTLMQGRTSFVIAHRLSTIRDAELILVMNNGKIVETGTHKDLLEKKGFYTELYQAQFAGQATAE
jgi:ATP-binding cassette, subfamily B, multidrug efflux pump